MSRNYKFHDPKGAYFVSFAVVKWMDVFSNDKYKGILIDSLHYCQEHKGMEIYAWCIMPDHVHLIFRSIQGEKPELLLGDFKRFTSKAIVKELKAHPEEEKSTVYLKQFSLAATRTSNVKDYQFWQHHNQPIEVWSHKVTSQKINYVHQNPVKAGLVFRAEDYLYGSARDYSEQKGILNHVLVCR